MRLKFCRSDFNRQLFYSPSTTIWCHHLERAFALIFKDARDPKFGHGDLRFDLFIETRFLHLNINRSLIQFFKTFSAFQVPLDQKNLTSCQKYDKFVYLAFLLMIFDDDSRSRHDVIKFQKCLTVDHRIKWTPDSECTPKVISSYKISAF